SATRKPTFDCSSYGLLNITQSQGLGEAEHRLKYLEVFSAGKRTAAICPADITVYSSKRQGDQASNWKIYCKLDVLYKYLLLVYENNKLLWLHVVRQLREYASRQEFFEREQFEDVRSCLRPDLQGAASIVYTFGWLMQSEALTLELRQINLSAGALRL